MRSCTLAWVLALCLPPVAAFGQTAVVPPSTQEMDARIDTLLDRMTVAEQVAQLQDRAPAIPRLGLPAYNWWNEGLHGIARNGQATVFPQAIGLAATWDAELLERVGDTVSTEARAKFNSRPRGDSPRYGGLTVWSPNINIFRDPRWGRGQETYGEDPYLTGLLGTAFVRGVQGPGPFYLKADATPKHFAVHSGPERGRDSFNAVASPHDLNDTYFAAFRAVITDAHAAAMMCSYNAINGTPSCANGGLLQQEVRDRWGFQGYVVSDCDAIGNITEFHHFTGDKVRGAAAALNAGTDLDCGNSYLPLAQALEQHLISPETLRTALHRLFRARLQLGVLDAKDSSPFDAIQPSENDSAAHQALALRAAEESIVLLKNDGALPLRSGQKIAVVGPTADMVKVLEGNYHGTASHPVTPLDGIAATFAGVRYAQGSLLVSGLAAPIPRTAFRVRADPNGPAGLTAEYFTAEPLDGQPVKTETVSKIDLDLDHAGPVSAIAWPHFAARWSGYLQPPAAGDYTFHVGIGPCEECATHARFKLLLDGKVVIENDGSHPEPNSATLHFADTTVHAIRFEFVHSGDDQGLALEWEPPAGALLDEAVTAANDADVVLAFVGLSSDLEGEEMPVHFDGFSGGDRLTLDLPAAQRDLLARLETLHKPMVIVLTSGSAVSLGAAELGASAILEAWYPGEVGGTALANIVAGKTSPSGRLPVTFYRSVSDLPAFSDYSMAHRTYRYFDGPVLYPFGFGLSYATFRYGAVSLSKGEIAAGDAVTATVTVTNTGAVAGGEVAELYLVPPVAQGSPKLALRGAERVYLRPNESRTVRFVLEPRQLSFVDSGGARAVRAGQYRIAVEGKQPAGIAGAVLRIVGEKSIPE